MDDVFHALADSSRRAILDMLAERPRTAGELADAFPISRPAVSRHLRVLREAGLVEAEQQAQRRIYSLKADAFAEADAWWERHRALWSQRLDALHTEVARGRRSKGERSKGERSKDERSKDERSKGERSKGERSKGERSKGERSKGSTKAPIKTRKPA